MTVELRDLAPEKLVRLGESLQGRAKAIAQQTRTSIEFRLANTTAPRLPPRTSSDVSNASLNVHIALDSEPWITVSGRRISIGFSQSL